MTAMSRTKTPLWMYDVNLAEGTNEHEEKNTFSDGHNNNGDRLRVPRTCANRPEKMSFFITSEGPGSGAALGGLAGADQHCQRLAEAAGAGNRTWHAYLSTSGSGGKTAVNARDRIGKGAWYNAKGVMVAKDIDDLHSEHNKLGKMTSLSEKGAVLNGRGDTPNQHDILTGTQLDGTTFPEMRTKPAATGLAVAKAALKSVITTARAVATTRLPGIPLMAQKAAAKPT